jgi:hypothetical protein
LAETIPGADWQIDPEFNAAEEILRDPTIKTVFRTVIAKGVKLVNLRS